MALVPVDVALAKLLDGIQPPDGEVVELSAGSGRVLSVDVVARRTQPPFPASAMDGYAVRHADLGTLPITLNIIGEAPAGRPFHGAVGEGEAVRIFTGAPVPAGADTVVIQENTRRDGDKVTVTEPTVLGRNIRSEGLDFREGDVLLERGRRLDPGALALSAAGNNANVTVARRPVVALIATGDELLPPGSNPGPGQIIASNTYGVAAIAESAGARVVDLGIAPDNHAAIAALVQRAKDVEADVLVTLGGASVGDHDIVNSVLTSAGMQLDFWKIAMRPGKPLMVGRMGRTRCIGLPGNPVASLVCSHLFVKPLILRLQGASWDQRLTQAALDGSLPENDLRQDYIRAVLTDTDAGSWVRPFDIQDSSMLRTFATANALIVREPFAAPAEHGSICRVLRLR